MSSRRVLRTFKKENLNSSLSRLLQSRDLAFYGFSESPSENLSSIRKFFSNPNLHSSNLPWISDRNLNNPSHENLPFEKPISSRSSKTLNNSNAFPQKFPNGSHLMPLDFQFYQNSNKFDNGFNLSMKQNENTFSGNLMKRSVYRHFMLSSSRHTKSKHSNPFAPLNDSNKESEIKDYDLVEQKEIENENEPLDLNVSKGGHEEAPTVPEDNSLASIELRKTVQAIETNFSRLFILSSVCVTIQAIDILWILYSTKDIAFIKILENFLPLIPSIGIVLSSYLTLSPLLFFKAMEGKQRLRAITLGIQVHKIIKTFILRVFFSIFLYASLKLLFVYSNVWQSFF